MLAVATEKSTHSTDTLSGLKTARIKKNRYVGRSSHRHPYLFLMALASLTKSKSIKHGTYSRHAERRKVILGDNGPS